MGRGLFSAIHEPGVELPGYCEGGRFNAHITALRAEEIKQLGGPTKVTEWGKPFAYQLGPLKVVEPHNCPR